MQKGAGAGGKGQRYDPAGEGGWGDLLYYQYIKTLVSFFSAFSVVLLASEPCLWAHFPWPVCCSALHSWEGCRRWLPRCRPRCNGRGTERGTALTCERKVRAEDGPQPRSPLRTSGIIPLTLRCRNLWRFWPERRLKAETTIWFNFTACHYFCSNLTEDLEPFFLIKYICDSIF